MKKRATKKPTSLPRTVFVMLTFSALCIGVTLQGCVAPQVTTQRLAGSSTRTDFGQYKTINYTLARSRTAEIVGDFGDKEIELFDVLLKRKLQAMGYTFADARVADFSLAVTINAAKPGNAGARLMVGFGAGRSVFTFDAKFADRDNKELASFTGGQAYTGLEAGAGLSSQDTIMAMAAVASISQIETFMRNGGQFPEVANSETHKSMGGNRLVY